MSPDRSGDSGSDWIADLSAGLVVFLVALPLCLGIALASDAPPFAGLLAGVLGGVVVGWLSGSHTSVSGPAAGLASAVALQIASLGSYDLFLTAVVLAGGLQIVLAALRAGAIAAFVPGSVIRGLLAAIGLILITKQLPQLVGYSTQLLGSLSLQPEANATGDSVWGHLHWGAGLIGLLSFGLLQVWESTPRLRKTGIPAALVVVLLAVVVASGLQGGGERWQLQARQLVQVPVAGSLEEFAGLIRLPDFTGLGQLKVLLSGVTIALIASLETLLNLEAVDKLDPRKRVSPPNRELFAQGVGNLCSGMLGGLPITSVIVRSSVNINSGARTRRSAIVHGVLLALCVACLPGWLNRIPLSCLAAILVATGLKLASPRLFAQLYRSGFGQFLPFVVTLVSILLTDLLIGIVIGLAFSVLFILHSNVRNPLRRTMERHLGGDVLRVELKNQVSFLNRAALLRTLDSVPEGGSLLLDATECDYIDADVLNLIREYQTETAPARGIRLSLRGFRSEYPDLADRVEFVDRSTRELQSQLSADQVLELLREGNRRFSSGTPLRRDLQRHRDAAAEAPHPLAIVLSGASSRVPVELVFDAGLGELISSRIAGNIPGPEVVATIEYGCLVGGASVVVLLGHTRNSLVRLAVAQALDREGTRSELHGTHLEPTLSTIGQSIDPRLIEAWPTLDESGRETSSDEVGRQHVLNMLSQLQKVSPTLQRLLQTGRLRIVGAIYDVRTGVVEFLPESPRSSPRTLGGSG